jgi:cAMP-dependent protein kinase regulator
LEKVSILKMMDVQERTKLADAFKEEWYEAGDYIIREGDKTGCCGSSFYMIIEGKCIATKSLEPGTAPVTVKHYQPGDYFGERALIRHTPRAANVIAQS